MLAYYSNRSSTSVGSLKMRVVVGNGTRWEQFAVECACGAEGKVLWGR